MDILSESSNTSAACPRLRDEDYYWETAVFLVEDYLFKVPRIYFEQKSDLFTAMFSLPQGDKLAEGTSDDNPIYLAGVTRSDFKNFLQVMYPSRFTASSPVPSDIWWSALKLATAWGFSDIRQEAIRALSKINMTSVERIINAQRYKIPQWFIQGCTELIRRSAKITQDEAIGLGIPIAIPLCHIREDYGPHSYSYEKDVAARVHQVFAVHLKDMESEDLSDN